MKLKTSLFLFTFIFCQFATAQNKTVNIESELTINKTEWLKDSQLTAQLTVKNALDREIEIRLEPHFILEKLNIDTPYITYEDKYISKEKQADYIITNRRKNGYSYKIRQFYKFSLKNGESKTLEFNLSKLAWNSAIESNLLDFSWYNVVPDNNYKLYYDMSYKLEQNKDTDHSVRVLSNKVEVKLNSEK